MALCNRVVKSGVNSAIFFAKSRAIHTSSSSTSINKCDYRHISQLVNPNNNKRAFLVDTLSLVRVLEAQGLPSKQAEAITEVLNDSLENVAHFFVSKAEMQKSEMIQDSNLSKFKSEVQSSQEKHFCLIQREIEKIQGDIDKKTEKLQGDIEKKTEKLGGDIEKLRIEMRCENDKVNIVISSEITNLTNKIDWEIHVLKAHLEAAKYDVIKYCIGTLISVCAVGIATVRILF